MQEFNFDWVNELFFKTAKFNNKSVYLVRKEIISERVDLVKPRCTMSFRVLCSVSIYEELQTETSLGINHFLTILCCYTDDVLSMFIRRIRAQVKQFQVLIKQFQAFLKAQQEHGIFAESAEDTEEQLTRDQFNLRKMILIVTSSGKLFGLDSADGSIIWKYFLPDLAPFTQNNKQYSLLYTQRTVAHFPLTAQCIVLGRSRSAEGSLLHVFNPITGKPIGPGHPKGNQLQYRVIQSMLLPHTGKTSVVSFYPGVGKGRDSPYC